MSKYRFTNSTAHIPIMEIITWGHHQVLMSKVSSKEEYVWHLEKTLEHGWSVDDLTSQVKSQLYERQVVANKISILKTDCLLNKSRNLLV